MHFENVVEQGLEFQGYGLTETGGGATRTIGPEETNQLASVGRLSENMEAKIVDPETGEGLGPGQRGELWLRGPTVMKGSDHGLIGCCYFFNAFHVVFVTLFF